MSRTYLVTGANRGLGLEFARQLSNRGDRVLATARDPRRATDLHALGVEVHALDVGDDASVAALAAALAGRPLDVLINNAGIGVGDAPLGRLRSTALVRFFEVNSVGPLRVVQALLPNLRAGKGRTIVNVTSRMGSIDDNHSGGAYGYRASKAALNMITRSLAVDLRPEGFICVVIHPGWVRTAMGGAEAPLSPAESVAGMLRVIERLSPRDSGEFFDHTGKRVPW